MPKRTHKHTHKPNHLPTSTSTSPPSPSPRTSSSTPLNHTPIPTRYNLLLPFHLRRLYNHIHNLLLRLKLRLGMNTISDTKTINGKLLFDGEIPRDTVSWRCV
ncbi:hypothetical protein E8E13_003963 [Curvularia kusanoi]|uniref:Uncharacterized protein n=1 Tax=Curvularia kusanoi TaxID=90978 RepID=A0A9P4T7W2_CURKU|nr:hypothetical protein E8E13_003963 [Curvularia kusanoi]